MDELQESLGRSPELFPHTFDVLRDSVSFVRLDRGKYEQASFLDARILAPDTISFAIPWPRVAASIEAAQLPERCGFIFHIGHVGSTLLSRLIGAHRGAFALREPMILRTFAQVSSDPGGQSRPWSDGDFEVRLTGALKLLSRTFDAHQTAVVKATSFLSELANRLMSRAAAPKAVMIFVSPESYIATILGGPNSRQEARMLTPGRVHRLHQRIGCEPWGTASLSEGEALALGWACEMSALAEAASAASERVFCVDFDEFLLDPSTLLRVFHHFGIDANAIDVREILDGPTMHRYSKAPEYAYDRPLRIAVLNEARASHGAEIRRGLAWLNRAAENHAAVRQAIAFAKNS